MALSTDHSEKQIQMVVAMWTMMELCLQWLLPLPVRTFAARPVAPSLRATLARSNRTALRALALTPVHTRHAVPSGPTLAFIHAPTPPRHMR